MLKRLLYRFAGEDEKILRDCDYYLRLRFQLIGCSVPLVFVLWLASSVIVFLQIFDQPLIGLLFSLFFAWMITSIYRLLLCTLSRNPLPRKESKGFMLLSLLLRFGFIGFLSLYVSQALSSVVFKHQLDQDIQEYKAGMKTVSIDTIFHYYAHQALAVKGMGRDSSERQQWMAAKKREGRQELQRIDHWIEASSYFLQRLRFLNTRHTACWGFVPLVMLLLAIPAYLCYSTRHAKYCQLRAQAEQSLVEADYAIFKQRYAACFQERYRRKLVYSESYEDPPYNTLRKKEAGLPENTLD